MFVRNVCTNIAMFAMSAMFVHNVMFARSIYRARAYHIEYRYQSDQPYIDCGVGG